MQPIASLRPGAKAAVLGEIKSANLMVTRRRGFKIFHAVVGDASGAIRCTWMNQPFLADILKPHLAVIVFGDVKLDSSGLHFMNPEYELVSRGAVGGAHRPHRAVLREDRHRDAEHAAAHRAGRRSTSCRRRCPTLLPVGSALAARPDAATPRRSRSRIFRPATADVDAAQRVPHAGAAATDLRGVLPLPDWAMRGGATRRAPSSSPSPSTVDDRIRASAAKVLPFRLTAGQRQAVKEIVDDMRRPTPMHRLLQGDVGRGQDDRRAAGGDRGDGERASGGVHGAHRNPRRAALRQHRAAAVAVALPGGPADREHAGPSEAHAPRAHRARHHQSARRHARARRRRS